MKCTECCYYWKNEDEAHARCHYEDPMFPAPCEYETMETADDPEDWEEEPEFPDDEMGFDPYEGCYTWDC